MEKFHYIAIPIPEFKGLKKIQRQVPEEILYVEEPGFGREIEPHVTILYGLHNENDYFTVRRILQSYKNIPIELGKISKFESDKYDVIKIEVESDACHKLHNQIKEECINTQTYDTYHPHVTIAYVKPGSYDSVINEAPNLSESFKIKECYFGHKDGYKIPLQVGKYGKI